MRAVSQCFCGVTSFAGQGWPTIAKNAYAVPGRWERGDLVPRKAVEALLMKLRILNRTALLAYTRLAERRVFLEQPLVLFALHDVALRRPGW